MTAEPKHHAQVHVITHNRQSDALGVAESRITLSTAESGSKVKPSDKEPQNYLIGIINRWSGGRSAWVQRFVSYFFVGGFAALVNLACFSLLSYRGPRVIGGLVLNQSARFLAVFVIAAEVSTLTNFIINDRVTFQHLPGHVRSWWARCIRFHITSLVGTLITLTISFTLAWIGIAAFIAETVAIGVAFLVNFTLHHIFTYRHKHVKTRIHSFSPASDQMQGRSLHASEPDLSLGTSASGMKYLSTHTYPRLDRSNSLEATMKFSIVIPAHNEEEALRPTLERLHATLTEEHIPFEILVVNDHSTDSTESVLQVLMQELPGVRYVNNQKAGGFGRAIQTGLEHFTGDAVCIVMADASDDARDVLKYYRKLEEGYECVFGSRFLRESKVVDYPRHKLFINRLANRFIDVLFRLGFNDTTNAFKAYRREVIAGVMPILAQHFNITVELPLKAITRGYSYTIVPINWYNRTSGVSKLKIKEMGSRYLFIVLYIWLEKKLSRGDYRRPQVVNIEAEAERKAALATYETMPHRAAHAALTNTYGDVATVDRTDSSEGQFANSTSQHHVSVGVLLSSIPDMATKGDKSTIHPGSSSANHEWSAARRPSLLQRRSGSWLMLFVSFILGCQILLMYGSTIHTDFVGDDWVFLFGAAHTPLGNFITPGAGYHYNPILAVTIWAMYHLFGVHHLAPYHLLAFTILWLTGVMVVLLSRKLTGSTLVGALTGVLFLGFGTQYEAAVWGVVAYGPGMSTLVYVTGLFCFIIAQDVTKSRLQRTVFYCGFVGALIAGPFIYEQDITLVAAALLYRVLVVDWSFWHSWREIKRRFASYVINFAIPTLYFCAYLAFKIWLGHRYPGIAETPGLTLPWNSLVFTATLGMFQVYIPGLTLAQMLHLMLMYTGRGHYLIVSVALLTTWIIAFIKAKPVYRFALVWALMAICAQTLGLGNISSRHLLLMTIPAAIVWAGTLASLPRFVGRLATRLQIPSTMSWQAGYTFSIIVALIFLFTGYSYSQYMVANWQGAVGHVDGVVAELKVFADADTSATSVYLINLPDYVSAPTGESFYEFRNSPQAIVSLLMPGRFHGITAVRTANDFPINFSYTVYATGDQIEGWAANPNNLVLQYDMSSGQLVNWQPPRPLTVYYNRRTGDHWVTTHAVDPTTGYVKQKTIAYLEPLQEPETIALYGCVTSSGDHFLSTQANCVGETVLGLEGWLYSSSQANVPIVPLYNCRDVSDHLASAQSSCAPGTLEGLLGYGGASR